MFDSSIPPELEDLRTRVATLIREDIIREQRNVSEHDGLSPDRLKSPRAKARAAGIYASHMPSEVHRMLIARHVLRAARERSVAAEASTGDHHSEGGTR